MPRKKAATLNPEQEPLPGAEQSEKIPEIIAAARAYVRERDRRILQSKEEKKAKDRLIGKMVDHGLTAYEYGGIAVLVDEKRDVKVTSPEHSGDGQPAAEAGGGE